MASTADSIEWKELQGELQALAQSAKAFNVHVFDIWDNCWCAARGFNEMPRPDLVDFIRAAESQARVALQRGGSLNDSFSSRMGHVFIRTYGSCYILLLRFSAPADTVQVRSAVGAALPRIEALTLRLPPSGGPGTLPHEAAKH